VTAGGSAPPAIAPGRVLHVTATLRVTRKAAVRIGLVLTNGTGAKGGIALGPLRRGPTPTGRVPIGIADARPG
jgi:hypothetical protein